MTTLRRILQASALVAFGAAIVLAPEAAAFVAKTNRPALADTPRIPERAAYLKHIPASDDASVIVLLPQSTGSGVHIGGGLILTAAHVVADGAAGGITIHTRQGIDAPATIVWANKDYDVALLQTSADLPAADLNCHTARVGSVVRTVGNPLGMQFVSSFGHVASSARQFNETWKMAFITDMTVIMGNSGGPVFDDRDRLAGIVVGVIGIPEANGVKAYLGFSTVVPSSAICELMGRK